MNSNIGEVLRLSRIANDFTLKEMANKLGVTPSYVSLIEQGKRNPSDDILNKYSEVLNMSKETLMLFGEENENGFSFQELLLKILKKIVEE